MFFLLNHFTEVPILVSVLLNQNHSLYKICEVILIFEKSPLTNFQTLTHQITLYELPLIQSL